MPTINDVRAKRTRNAHATRSASHPPRPSSTASHSLLTIEEAAEDLRISEAMVFRLLHSGELRAASIKIGRRRLFTRAGLDAFIAEQMAS